MWDLAMAMRPLLLVWLFAIFVVIAWRALRLAPADQQHNAMIPLRDDDVIASPPSASPGPVRARERGSPEQARLGATR